MKKRSQKFKIGDLVVSLYPLDLDLEEVKILEGDVGLVVELCSPDPQEKYDYLVLIRGIEVLFFHKELVLHNLSGGEA